MKQVVFIAFQTAEILIINISNGITLLSTIFHHQSCEGTATLKSQNLSHTACFIGKEVNLYISNLTYKQTDILVAGTSVRDPLLNHKIRDGYHGTKQVPVIYLGVISLYSEFQLSSFPNGSDIDKYFSSNFATRKALVPF